MDHKMFLGSPYRLCEHVTSIATLNAMECMSLPEHTLRLLMMLQYVVNNPAMGISGYNEENKSFATTNAFRNVVEQFIERVWSKSGNLIGFRFYFCGIDPRFKWDVGIGNLIEINKNDRKYADISKLTKEEYFIHSIRSKEEWISDIIGYWDNDGKPNVELHTKMMTRDFSNFEEASLPVAYSYERAMNFFPDAIEGPCIEMVDERAQNDVAADFPTDPTHTPNVEADPITPEKEVDVNDIDEEDSEVSSPPTKKLKRSYHSDESTSEDDSSVSDKAESSEEEDDDDESIGGTIYTDPAELPKTTGVVSLGSELAVLHMLPTPFDNQVFRITADEDVRVIFEIPAMFQNPVGLYLSTLYSFSVDSSILNKTPKQIRDVYLEKIRLGEIKSRYATVLSSTVSLIEGTLEKNQNLSEYERRLNSDVQNYALSFMNSEEAPPGIAACVKYVKECRSKAQLNKTTWSAIRVRKRGDQYYKFASNLSDFGNFVASFMYDIEHAMEMDHLHHELFMSFIASLHAFRVRQDMQLHIMDNGPAASGKSHMQKMVMMMLVTGTYMMLSNITEKGFTGNESYDGMNFFLDEMPKLITDKGKSGTGDNIVKSLMMGVPISTMMVNVNKDTRERETVTSESNMRVRFHGGENSSLNTIPDPIKSRTWVRTVPVRKRKGLEFLQSRRAKKSRGMEKYTNAFIEKCNIMTSLCGMLDAMILVKAIPEVDMSYAEHLMSMIRIELVSRGLLVDPRARLKINMAVRELTLTYAVNKVFFTPEVFSDLNTEFSERHLLYCMPYMYATEEIVFFAVTCMADTMVYSCAGPVCRALKQIAMNQERRNSIAAAAATINRAQSESEARANAADNNVDEDDNLYYTICLGRMEDQFLFSQLKKLIIGELAANSSVKYSDENIQDFLTDHMNKTSTDSSAQNRPIMHIPRRLSLGMKKFQVLKSFVDAQLKHVNSNAVVEAIQKIAESSKPAFLIGSPYRDYDWRFSTGDGSYRLDHPYDGMMFPHVYQMTRGLNKDLNIVGINPEYMPRGCCVDIDEEFDDSLPMHTEIKSKEAEHFAKYGGKKKDVMYSSIFNNYPDDVIAESFKEINVVKIERGSSAARATSTTTQVRPVHTVTKSDLDELIM